MTKTPEVHNLKLRLNGEERETLVRPRETLLEVLRDRFGILGPKEGCGNGDCGACTVLLNREPVKACLILALEAENQEITTVEGIDDPLLKESLMDSSAFQCGYCASGFIVALFSLLQNYPDPSEEQIKKRLSSNLCRCTGYEGILRAAATYTKKRSRR